MEPWVPYVLGTIATVIIGGLTALFTYRSSVKVKKLDVDGEAYLRAKGITADLILELRQEIKDVANRRKEDKVDHDAEMAKRDLRLENVENEVRAVREHNNALTTFIYKLLAIFRQHNMLDQIDPLDVPEGIHL
jgi:hypothetical protein